MRSYPGGDIRAYGRGELYRPSTANLNSFLSNRATLSWTQTAILTLTIWH
jgi:hypothetical protein